MQIWVQATWRARPPVVRHMPSASRRYLPGPFFACSSCTHVPLYPCQPRHALPRPSNLPSAPATPTPHLPSSAAPHTSPCAASAHTSWT